MAMMGWDAWLAEYRESRQPLQRYAATWFSLSCWSVHWNPAMGSQRTEQHHPRRRRAGLLINQ